MDVKMYKSSILLLFYYGFIITFNMTAVVRFIHWPLQHDNMCVNRCEQLVERFSVNAALYYKMRVSVNRVHLLHLLFSLVGEHSSPYLFFSLVSSLGLSVKNANLKS